MRRLVPALAALVWPWMALAQPGVSVEGAWCLLGNSRPDTAFVYFTLSVTDQPSETLLGAETLVALRVDILSPRLVAGRQVLQKAESVRLDAAAPTVFQPQDTHLMLSGLKRKLAAGDSFTLTLDFAGAGRQDTIVRVVRQPPSAGMPDPPKDVQME